MTAIYILEEVCAIERSSDAMEDHFIKTPPKRLICRSYVHSCMPAALLDAGTARLLS